MSVKTVEVLSSRVVLTVHFDSEVWGSLSLEDQVGWVQDVVNMVNNEAYVSQVSVTKIEVTD